MPTKTKAAPSRSERTNLPAHQTKGSVPAYLKKGEARGRSTDARDSLVPLIYILQPLSPQVMKKNPAFIEGSEAGDVWLKGFKVIPGDEGFDFQPVAFWKSWTEWVPRDSGGGLAGVYENKVENGADVPINLPKDAEKDEEGGFNYVRKNGNIIVLNRCHAGLVYDQGPQPLPFVMILSSTGHTFSRQWTTAMNQTLMDEKTGALLDTWAKKWTIKTEHKQNKSGEWFMYTATAHEDWVSEDEYAIGEKLYRAFESREKKAEMEDTTAAPSAEGGRRGGRGRGSEEM